jgi:hypothetical protein
MLQLVGPLSFVMGVTLVLLVLLALMRRYWQP